MARPRHKKQKMKSDTHTKSVFLHGKLNEAKRLALEKLQTHFTFFIGFLNGREDCLMQLLKNDKKDSHMRRLEKENRRKDLMCAYSQNYDVKELMGDYPPMVTGQSIENGIFVCRRAENHCMISLQPDFWNAINHAWWLCIRCTLFGREEA